MRPMLFAAIVSLAVSPALAADPARTDRPMENVPIVGGLMKTDSAEFAQKAMDDSNAEVELGRLALKNSENAQVKEYANLMIKDHSAAGEELKKIIASENIKLSEKPDDKAKDMHEKLAGLKGADFDRAYMDDMVDDHEDAVDLFEDYAKDGDNAKLKQFASKTVPTLRAHLDKAKALEAKLGNR